MSSMSLNKLVFDPANLADSANVGAYLRASDGTLLTHTGGALDVNITSGVNVEVDLSHVDDSVRLGDGTSFFTSTSENGDISLDVHLSNTSIAVTATDLDIRNLSAAQDNVAISDGVDTLAINADGSISTVPGALNTSAHGAVSVGSTATDIVGTDLSGRRQILVQNLGNKDVFLGNSASVTISNGILLAAGSNVVLDAGAAVNLHGITSSGTSDVRYFELAS